MILLLDYCKKKKRRVNMSTKLVHLIIEEKRKEMIQLAEDYGYTSNLTVQASQELDYLLNTFSPSDQPYLVSSN